VGEGPDADGVDRVEERAAELVDRRGRPHEVERHVHRELLGHADDEEIDVESSAGHRVVLDVVDEHAPRARAIDLEIDKGVARGMARQVGERLRVDLDGFGRDVVAVDHGRQEAVRPELAYRLAGDRPGVRCEGRSGVGHGSSRGRTCGRHGSTRGPGYHWPAMAAAILIVEDEYAVARGIEY